MSGERKMFKESGRWHLMMVLCWRFVLFLSINSPWKNEIKTHSVTNIVNSDECACLQCIHGDFLSLLVVWRNASNKQYAELEKGTGQGNIVILQVVCFKFDRAHVRSMNVEDWGWGKVGDGLSWEHWQPRVSKEFESIFNDQMICVLHVLVYGEQRSLAMYSQSFMAAEVQGQPIFLDGFEGTDCVNAVWCASECDISGAGCRNVLSPKFTEVAGA